jgi:NADH pyrophosphatase NudC (nudix superfamily)
MIQGSHYVTIMLDAIVVVIMKGDKILLIERAPRGLYSGYWAPVSGKVEPGESQEAAVVRESMEEVGLKVRPVRKVWENITTSGTYRLHWWLAEYVGGELVLDKREVSDARWVTLEEIDRFKIFDGDREFYLKVLPPLLKRMELQ